MTSYNEAVRRLKFIHAECFPKSKEKVDESRPQDEFSVLRRQLATEGKQIRQMIKEREELLGSKPGSKEAAEASHRIRSRIKQMREEAMKLQNIQKQDEKKLGDVLATAQTKENSSPNDRTSRGEIVQLVFKHIEEIENLEKKRYTEKNANDRAQLFSGAPAGSSRLQMVNFSARPDAPNNPGDGSALPEIDPEVSAGLQQLEATNQDIDRDLDQIRSQVGQLKEIAINMDQEMQKQDAMLRVVDGKVDKAQEHLEHINLKMKKAVDGVMKGDRFVVSCILVSILLCLVGFILSYYV